MPQQTLSYVNDHLIPAFDSEDAPRRAVQLANGTYAAGTVLGRRTSDGLYVAYADGNSNGSQQARGILEYGVTVAGGVVTTLDDFSRPVAVSMYVGGAFMLQDLTGLDAAAVEDLGGVVTHTNGAGTVGLFRF